MERKRNPSFGRFLLGLRYRYIPAYEIESMLTFFLALTTVQILRGGFARHLPGRFLLGLRYRSIPAYEIESRPTVFLALTTAQILRGDFARHLPARGFRLRQSARLCASLCCAH